MFRLLAALVVSVALVGCGDDDDAQSGSTPAPKSDAPAAEGTGYTVQPPEGFGDGTSQFEGSAFKVDLALIEKGASDFATNLVVIRETPGSGLELDEVMAAFTKQAEAQATDEGISEVEERELDGVPARTYAFRARSEANGPVRQRQVVAVKDDAIYTLTWSVAADEFEEQEATLDQLLASWRWTGG